MSTWFSVAKNRIYLYSIAGTGFAVAVFYNLLDPNAVPIWLALLTSLLGIGTSGMAIANINPPKPSVPLGDHAA